MLSVNTIFSSEGIIAKTFRACYDAPYTENDYNAFPALSLTMGSCFKYKCFNHEFLLSSNEILSECGSIEYQVTKLPLWKKDSTLSLVFTNPEHPLSVAITKTSHPVSIQKRSFFADYTSRTILEKKSLSALQTEQLVIDLIEHLHVEKGSKKEDFRINLYSIRQVEEAKDFIYSNYNRKIQIGDIANSVHISLFHFCRLFKKITGMSPYHFLLLVRLEASKSFLNQGESVTRAAVNSGFDSLEHFSHAFKRYSGFSPGKVFKRRLQA